LNQVKSFFLPPFIADETLTRRASLLSFIVNVHLTLAFGVSILLFFFVPQPVIFPIIALLSGLPALGVRFLLLKGNITLAGLILCS